jgi:hypothetical protein
MSCAWGDYLSIVYQQKDYYLYKSDAKWNSIHVMVHQSMFKILQIILIVLVLISCTCISLSSNCPKVEEFPFVSICYLGDNKTKVQIS